VEDYDQDNAITTLRPNKFRPQAGARNRVRSRLQEVLIEDENEEDVPSGRPRTPQSPIPSPTERPEEKRTSLEYVELNRGPPPTQSPTERESQDR